MSVIVNTIGTNSRQIVISAETTGANIIAAIDSALIALGWTAFDSTTTGTKNLLVTKVYSAACVDTVTTKYLIIRYDAGRQFFYTSCAESWNATTHIATNECWTFTRTMPLSFQYGSNIIYLFASARYALFQCVLRGENGPWQGVVEWEREAPDDTAVAGYPCFGWVNSTTMGGTYNSKCTGITGGPTPYCVSMPRTRTGKTGAYAAYEMIFSTSHGTFPPNAQAVGANYGSINSTNTLHESVQPHHGMLGAFGYGYAYSWDTGKKIISSLRLSGMSSSIPTGRIYGLKVIPNSGNILDTTQVPVDVNGFFSNAGTNANHYVLGLQGGAMMSWGSGANKIGVTQLPVNSYGYNTQNSNMFIYQGKYMYIFYANGSIGKFDLETNSYLPLVGTALAYGATMGYAFDGGNYLYVSVSGTAAGILRIDLTNDSVTLLVAGTGGCFGIALDDTYLYTSSKTASTTPTVQIVVQSTFAAVARTYTVSPAINSAVMPQLDTCDYKGYVLAPTTNSASTTDSKIFKINGADGIATVFPMGTTNWTGTYLNIGWDGTDLFLVHGVNTNPYYDGFNPTTGTNSWTTLAVTSSNLYQQSVFTPGKLHPAKGMWCINGIDVIDTFFLYQYKSNELGTVPAAAPPAYVAWSGITGAKINNYYNDGATLFVNSIGATAALSGMFKFTNMHGIRTTGGIVTASILVPA